MSTVPSTRYIIPLAAWASGCQLTNSPNEDKSTHLPPSNDSSLARFEQYTLPSFFTFWMRKGDGLLIEERGMRSNKVITEVLLRAELCEVPAQDKLQNRHTGTI